jgi:hypothetical protein
MDLFEAILMLFGSFLLLSFLSFLWFGASYEFILAESILVGAVYAQGLYQTINSLQGSWLTPMLKGNWLLLVPFLIGALAFTRFTKVRWLARYTISFQSGIGVGVAVAMTLRSELVNIVSNTVSGIVKNTGWALTVQGTDAFSAIVMFTAVITCITFYLYSVTYSNVFYKGYGKLLPKIGRAFMYATLGYKVQLKQPTEEVVVAVRRTIDELSLWLRG